MAIDYSKYEYLDIKVDDGVAIVTITHPAYDMRGHFELSYIWRDLELDTSVRSTLLTWAVPPSRPPLGPHFPPEMGPEARAKDPAQWWSNFQGPVREMREGILHVMDTNKLVVSVLRGDVPYGASLVLATIADISVAAKTAIIADRHIDGGMVPGDGAVLWMLSCGVQKAKLLALTGEEITGEMADRIGLVSLSVPDEEAMATGMRYARKLANGPQHTQYFTKRAFNNWLKQGHLLTFDLSNALEQLGMMSDPDFGTAAQWGKAEQGEPRDYDPATRPEYPSVSKPYPRPSFDSPLNRRPPKAKDGK